MCKRREWFKSYADLDAAIEVILGDGKTTRSVGSGGIRVLSFNGKKWIERTIKGVLYVPDICVNLFSSTKSMDNGHTSYSDRKQFTLLDGDDVVAVGERKGGMFRMLFKVIEPHRANVAVKCNSLRICHERLEHPNIKHVRDFVKRSGIDFIDEQFDCDGCAYGKQYRLSFGLRDERAKTCGHMIHADVCGPIE